jgi:hypothetical protein
MSIERVQAVYAADRRLTFLRLLADGGATANTSIIEKGLIELGHPKVDRAVANADARWLAAAGLATIEELRPDLLLVSITDKGERAACGKLKVDGVARPSAD